MHLIGEDQVLCVSDLNLFPIKLFEIKLFSFRIVKANYLLFDILSICIELQGNAYIL